MIGATILYSAGSSDTAGESPFAHSSSSRFTNSSACSLVRTVPSNYMAPEQARSEKGLTAAADVIGSLQLLW
jgi:hypothetical protein